MTEENTNGNPSFDDVAKLAAELQETVREDPQNREKIETMSAQLVELQRRVKDMETRRQPVSGYIPGDEDAEGDETRRSMQALSTRERLLDAKPIRHPWLRGRARSRGQALRADRRHRPDWHQERPHAASVHTPNPDFFIWSTGRATLTGVVPPAHGDQGGRVMSAALSIAPPEELLDAIAARAAELVLERLATELDWTMDRPWLTIEEAAQYLRPSRLRIYDLRSSGKLSRYGDGRRALVSRAELDELGAARSSRVVPALPKRPLSGSRSAIGR